MISARFILALTFASIAFGQANNTELEIEAIEAHFTNAGLVPSLLATFDPSALLSVSYDGVGVISPGQSLTKARELDLPALSPSVDLIYRGRGVANAESASHTGKFDGSAQWNVHRRNGGCRGRWHGRIARANQTLACERHHSCRKYVD